MPRHGVGLNELLGGGGCRCEPIHDALAESRSGKARARTVSFQRGVTEATASAADNLTMLITVSEACQRDARAV